MSCASSRSAEGRGGSVAGIDRFDQERAGGRSIRSTTCAPGSTGRRAARVVLDRPGARADGLRKLVRHFSPEVAVRFRQDAATPAVEVPKNK
jgi:hypothetical protein